MHFQPFKHVISVGKFLLAKLPNRWLLPMRGLRARKLIRQGTFDAGEPEFDHLADWLRPGDWALDIGANIGTYSIRMSRLVGDQGRVIAFEPVPETFSILASNLVYAGCKNVSAINAAASDKGGIAQMRIPLFGSGLENHYQASMANTKTNPNERAVQTLTLAVDDLHLAHRLALVKVDAEGHEQFVLGGMRAHIARDRPILILETTTSAIEECLAELGYTVQRFAHSPNRVFICERM